MNIIKKWLFNSGRHIRNIKNYQESMQMAQSVHLVRKRAERAKAYGACKEVRVICFNYLNVVGSLMASRF